MPFVVMIAIFIPFFKEGDVIGSYNIWHWQLKVTYDGLHVLINIIIKSWLSILSLIWLTSTTGMTNLLNGMEQLRMPHIMIMILSFMYRYLFVLVDETMRMKQARDSRNFGGRRLWQIRTIGNIIGILFIRSYERGERIYTAMVARGFDGHTRALNQLKFKLSDACFGISCNIIIILITVFSLVY